MPEGYAFLFLLHHFPALAILGKAGRIDQNLFVRRPRPVKLSGMVRPIHILLLSACSLVSAQVEFSDTRTIEYGLRENTGKHRSAG
jgi:hypothetical protein